MSEYANLGRVMRDAWQRWRSRQLAYYNFPSYYQRFYPPRPPTVNAAEVQSHVPDSRLASDGKGSE